MNIKILISLILFSISIQAQIINFPDTNFKEALLNHNPVIDINGDNEIQISEANDFTYNVNVSIKNICDLTGFEYFINTPRLICNNNNLTNLDLSQNIALTGVGCGANQITNLNVSNNVNLAALSCEANNLTSLDLSNTSIGYLNCNDNQITTLKLPNTIYELHCEENNFTSLDISNLINLDVLYCEANYNLTSININGCNLFELYFEYTQISTLDLTGNTNLQILAVPSNEITALNLSNLPNLRYLYCGGNQISTLDVSHNPLLRDLGASSNFLNDLDVTNLLYLKLLWCHHNNINTLDLSNNTQLTDLYFSNNNLEYLDLRNNNNENLTFLWADSNPNLSCVYVDNVVYSQTNWTNLFDSTVNFVETEAECEALSTNENILETNLVVYPNPVKDNLFIKNSINIKQVDVYNTLGQLIMVTDKSNIDFSNLKEGVYFIKVKTVDGNILSTQIIKL